MELATITSTELASCFFLSADSFGGLNVHVIFSQQLDYEEKIYILHPVSSVIDCEQVNCGALFVQEGSLFM